MALLGATRCRAFTGNPLATEGGASLPGLLCFPPKCSGHFSVKTNLPILLGTSFANHGWNARGDCPPSHKLEPVPVSGLPVEVGPLSFSRSSVASLVASLNVVFDIS